MNILLSTAYIREVLGPVIKFIGHVTSLSIPSGWRLHLGITDNSGTWPQNYELPSNVHIFNPGNNLGYLGGCRYVLEKWIEQNETLPNYFGIVNNDIEFESDFFVKLINLVLPNDVGIIAPDIQLSYDGIYQNPFLKSRLRPLKILFLRSIYYHNILAFIYELTHRMKRKVKLVFTPFLYRLSKQSNAPEYIYAPHGSAIFIRPSFFMGGGSLSFRGFMTGEENFLAEEAIKAGLKVIWVPNMRIKHYEHSAVKFFKSTERFKWSHDSLKIIWEDYYKGKSFWGSQYF